MFHNLVCFCFQNGESALHYAIKAGHYDELEELVRVLFRVKSKPVAKLVINMPADVSSIILIFVCCGFIYLWATMSGQSERDGMGRDRKFSSCRVQVEQLLISVVAIVKRYSSAVVFDVLEMRVP